MKRFYERYKDEDPKLLQAVAVLPWGNNLLFLDKGLDSEQVAFYAQEVITKGWSREMLLHAVKGNYYTSLLATPKSNNFDQTLPAPVADYANEVFRSRYNLGFLDAKEPMKELKLERRLIKKITRFILELGKGFTFIGLILCAEKDHLDVEVALQDIGKPIGVAEYQYLLPKDEILHIVSSEMNKPTK